MTGNFVSQSRSEANDYVNRVRIMALVFNGVTTLVDDNGLGLNSQQLWTSGNANFPVTIGGTYNRVIVRVDCVNDGAQELDVSQVEVQFYYG